VVEQGAAADILLRPRADYTKALIAAAFALEADETGVVET
jgi:microcin C transport system ATP-binding protein